MISGVLASGGPLRAIFDAIPSMVFVVDENVLVLDANQEARRTLGAGAQLVLRRLCGEVLCCLHQDEPAGCQRTSCGTTEACKTCVLRASTAAALDRGTVSRRQYTMTLERAGERREVHLLVSANAFEHDGRRLVLLILEDVTEVTELRRLVPICSWCKRVRSDGEYHATLEAYLAKHTLLELTHCICPECFARKFPEP